MEYFKDKTILITGGTGSFGRNFARFLLKNSALKKLIILSRDEFKQFQMQKAMPDSRLRFFIGDVRDKTRLERAFYSVDIVVHAAALKQVPALEYNPFEAIKTNTVGSQNVIEAAIDQGVKKILLISTDKAVQPINLYGASKLCAEKLFIAGNHYSPSERKSKFSVVRYGNVIGSRGSIIETLLKLKKSNQKKAPLTDPAMTRFWISLEQSFALVIFALKNMAGGEIFIPKAPSMKIVDLFEAIAPELEREIIGIRAGEKTHEILLTAEESKHAVELNKYFVVLPQFPFSKKPLYQKYYLYGRKLKPNFSFNSQTNTDWLTKEDLLRTFKKMFGSF